jgi:serine/threonine protein kinase
LLTEYSVAVREGKEIILPAWFWPSTISPLVTTLLVGLLQSDPSVRLSAAEALRHPWCQGLSMEDFKAASVAQRLFADTVTSASNSTSAIVTASISGNTQSSMAPLLHLPIPVPKPCLPRAVPPNSWRFGSRQPTPDLTSIREDDFHASSSMKPPAIPYFPPQSPDLGVQYEWTAGQSQQRAWKENDNIDQCTRHVGNIRLSIEQHSVINEELFGQGRRRLNNSASPKDYPFDLDLRNT